MRNWLLNICNKYNLDPKYVYELDEYISKLRYVAAGDIIEADDHNNIVDTLKKARDVIYNVEANVYNEGYQDGYQKGYQDGYQKGLAEAVSVESGIYKSVAQKDYSVTIAYGVLKQ